jgi:hypothetical protein
MVLDLARARVDPWLLFDDGPEPDLHMEIPDAGHGRLVEWAYTSSVVSGDEP